jgi:hypothetical protein
MFGSGGRDNQYSIDAVEKSIKAALAQHASCRVAQSCKDYVRNYLDCAIHGTEDESKVSVSKIIALCGPEETGAYKIICTSLGDLINSKNQAKVMQVCSLIEKVAAQIKHGSLVTDDMFIGIAMDLVKDSKPSSPSRSTKESSTKESSTKESSKEEEPAKK